MDTRSRIQHIQTLIASRGMDAFFISSIKNVRYLTGFTGSSGFVLLTKTKSLFFTDFRYKEQSASEVRDSEVAIEKGKRIPLLRKVARKMGIRTLGFEASLPYDFYADMKRLPLVLKPQKDLFEKCRMVKNEEEVAAIQKAIARAEEAFLTVKPRIRVGAREREIALRLEEHLKRAGCRTMPFEIIVASGKNASMPHAKPTEKKIEAGDFVIIDWGGEADGYCSDMTRTLLMSGKTAPEKRRIYDLVNTARKKAIASVKEGVRAHEIDRAARTTITQAGYGDFFGHGTGHGVGLDVHEYPYISRLGNERITHGMIFTVEPGIYLPKTGGVRIEDMVLVKQGRGVLLTTLSRELQIIK